MREIKFRARNAAVPRCWIYGYFVIEQGCCYIINDDGRFKVIAGTQSQFTNLKDAKNKEIYKGDIIGTGFWHHAVEFRDGTFKLGNANLAGLLGGRAKIIGNISENPELLKDGK